MNNNKLSCLVLTYNEAANIRNLLDSLHWLQDILIIDSGSTDETLSYIAMYGNVSVVTRKFDTFANQCNFGLSQLSSDWVLSLDADYVVTCDLQSQIRYMLSLDSKDYSDSYDAYKIPFKYCINGKSIRSGLLPPRICLYRRTLAHYIDVGHAHKVQINGKIGKINAFLLHNDRKPLKRWIQSQIKYQKIEGDMLKVAKVSDLAVQDRLRRNSFAAPFVAFFICLTLRGGILDGKEGLIYAFQRLVAESLLYLSMHVQEAGMDE